jgi:DNA-directed DNA polymerase III PolC
MYINCKTYFSFRYGTFSTEELVTAAGEHGLSSIALTNINNTCDVWDFVDHCKQAGIKPIAGAEIRNEDRFMYLLLAVNNSGFEKINAFISQHLHDKVTFPRRPVFDHEVIVIYPLADTDAATLESNEYIGVNSTEVNRLFNSQIKTHPSRYVMRHPVTFRDKEAYIAHRLLRAIDKNIIISRQQKEEIAENHETFLEPVKLLESFRSYPSIVTNTLKLMEACSIHMEFGKDKTKKLYSASAADDKILLEKLALDGMLARYGSKNNKARERVQRELGIIADQGFNAYFLITWDIIRYARSREFFYVGRGSGANSIVAYCLHITDVDPLELDLYFERFLNPRRTVPPDFDIDFSWRDRDEIIDYIFKRYGREHVALLGAYATFQEKALKRELGKVFGLPKEEIDQLEHGNMKDDKIRRHIEKFSLVLKDFPNHLSIHAGGMLISDQPISRYTATELPPKGFPTTQMDMHMAEKIGMYKLDILSQRGLGHIRETIQLVKTNQQVTIDITQVEKFKRDKNIAAQIRNAETTGCFYIESPGMRQLLKKLKCDDYLTLVAASSIIRPGVSQSGMMKQYIHRYHHPREFEYLHPKMEELLRETYGVMVYQEDVIKVAHHFAGLDMAEADVLRRAMSGKYRGRKEFENIREKFFQNCRDMGYDEAITQEVWRQIESFGGYSFSKAHSASFAVESYQSLYLKTYFPVEFMVAVINNFGGFYDRELYFHELKKTGARIHLPCANHSTQLTRLTGTDVYMGFIHVQALEEGLTKKLIDERNVSGPFTSLQDFIERIQPALSQLNILIRVGAFRFTGKNKKELLWEANFLKKQVQEAPAAKLFQEQPKQFHLPVLAQHPYDDALDEIELLGFPLCNVFELVDADLTQFVKASELPQWAGKEVTTLGYLITTKPVRTRKREVMLFGTFIDREGAWLDTVHFPEVQSRYPLIGKGFYRIRGKVVEEFGVYTIEVKHCTKMGRKTDVANV